MAQIEEDHDEPESDGLIIAVGVHSGTLQTQFGLLKSGLSALLLLDGQSPQDATQAEITHQLEPDETKHDSFTYSPESAAHYYLRIMHFSKDA